MDIPHLLGQIQVLRAENSTAAAASFQIPAISGFWTLSLVLQLPTVLFMLLSPAVVPVPFEVALLTIHLLFLVVEVGHIPLVSEESPQICSCASSRHLLAAAHSWERHGLGGNPRMYSPTSR